MKPRKSPVERATIEILREKITRLVYKSPDKAAILLTEWVHEREKARSTPEKKKKAA